MVYANCISVSTYIALNAVMKCRPDVFLYFAVSVSTLGSMLPKLKKKRGRDSGGRQPRADGYWRERKIHLHMFALEGKTEIRRKRCQF